MYKKEEPDYDALIFSWYKKAIGEDYFSKFVFMYLAFISFLRKKKFPQYNKDRQAIDALKKDGEVKNNFYEWYVKVDRQMQVRIEGLIKELKKLPLKNETDGQEKLVVINSIDDWDNIIEFIYIIRNNLFHGEKSPDSFRDYVMVQYAYELINPIVSIFIRELDLKRIYEEGKKD